MRRGGALTGLPRLAAALLAWSLALAAPACSQEPPSGAPAPRQAAPTVPATTEDVESLLARGRALLEAGDPAAAEEALSRASALDGGSFRTQVWLLRAWMELGRSNDTLDALDALRDEGRSGPALDYLYGMAFALRARQQVAEGADESSIRMNFADAVRLLSSATSADPEEYRDAFLPLAGAAWYVRDLERARAAAETAVSLAPRSSAARLALGRIAASRFHAALEAAAAGAGVEPGALGPERWGADVRAPWDEACAAFEATIALVEQALEPAAAPPPTTDPPLPPPGTPTTPPARSRAQLVDAALQLGHLRVLGGLVEQAADAYGTAMAWEPGAVDYLLVRERLASAGPADAPGADGAFRRALEHGRAGFARRAPPEDPRDATLSWWLGTLLVAAGERAEGIGLLRQSVAEEPGYVNAWHHVGLAHAAEGELAEAADAFVRGWEADPAAMLAELRRAPAAGVPVLERLIGASHAERPAEAAVLAEMCAEAEPREPRHWNNMGLFLRRQALDLRDRPRQREGGAPTPASLFERSLAAYRRALELAPEDPQLLNDTAVLLHHDLERELGAADGMYRRAIALAEAALADPELPAADRERFATALDDARKNLTELEQLLERRARGEHRAAGKG